LSVALVALSALVLRGALRRDYRGEADLASTGTAVCLVLIVVAVSLGKWVAAETGLDTMLKGIFKGPASPESLLVMAAIFALLGFILMPLLRQRSSSSTGGHTP
jgi:hypothetical protein